VLLGREFSGIFRSDDGGATWSRSGQLGSAANLEVDIRYLGQNNAVEAGKKASFHVTVTNKGPTTSYNTVLYVDWGRGSVAESIGLVPAKGSCTPDSSGPDCSLGDLASGESVLVGVEGNTEWNLLFTYTYTLGVVADNDQSSGSGRVVATVKTYNPEIEIGGGGGGGFGPLGLVLLVIGGLVARARESRTLRALASRECSQSARRLKR